MKVLKTLSVILFVVGLLAAGLYSFNRVQNQDATGPVIRMDSDTIYVSINASKGELLKGVTASDAKDGDVTDQLMVESLSNFVESGERTINIVAFDSDNNVTHATRTLVYTDYEDSHFTLEKPFEFALNTSSLISNLSVTDVLDGNITNRLITYNAGNSSFDKTSAGEYPVIFSVTNSAGGTSRFTATVTMIDRDVELAAGMTLSDYMIYLKKGEEFDPVSFISSVTITKETFVSDEIAENLIYRKRLEDGTEGDRYVRYIVPTLESSGIDIEGLVLNNPVNTEVPGWYEVTYGLSDVFGSMYKTHLLVCVEE